MRVRVKFKGIIFTAFSILTALQVRGYCIYYTGSDGPKVNVYVYENALVGEINAYYKALHELRPGQEGCWNWEDIKKDVFGGDATQNTTLYMEVASEDGTLLASGALRIGSYAELWHNSATGKMGLNLHKYVADGPHPLVYSSAKQ